VTLFFSIICWERTQPHMMSMLILGGRMNKE